ncbi:hypothetical protein [Pyrobaculum sp.]|uniref:hypothetical protein n=1 Tax=Pyrobaculum sp. TaxID=2004705 RepID=UPI003D0A2A42
MSASRPATFGTGLILAVVGIFLGGALASVFSSLMKNMTRYMGARAELPWWSDLSRWAGEAGNYYVSLVVSILGVIIAVAILAEWYIAAKTQS